MAFKKVSVNVFVFDYKLKVTREMWVLMKSKTKNYNSMADYLRTIIAHDLNCDTYGKQKEKNQI